MMTMMMYPDSKANLLNFVNQGSRRARDTLLVGATLLVTLASCDTTSVTMDVRSLEHTEEMQKRQDYAGASLMVPSYDILPCLVANSIHSEAQYDILCFAAIFVAVAVTRLFGM
jgi:hypothetical protein